MIVLYELLGQVSFSETSEFAQIIDPRINSFL